MWIKNYPGKNNAKAARYRAKKKQATVKWANEFFIEEIYQLARLRTDATGIKFVVDHVIPLTSRIVCGLHCETNLAVITETENAKKHNRHAV